MKEYKVEWRKHGTSQSDHTHLIKASSFEDAVIKASAQHMYGECDYLYVECTNSKVMKRFENPHASTEETATQLHSQQPTGSGGSAEWHESLGAVAKNIRNQVSPPQSSGWATLYRVCGYIILLVGFIGTIGIAQKDEEAGFQFAIVAITLALSSFLAAFLIDVLTDMRHYLKRIAEKE